jgi:trehalose 6-phosphate phosphatase
MTAGTTTLSLPLALERDEWLVPLRRVGAAAFLDYDGTLTPIVARPELAVLSEDMRGTIRRLAATLPLTIVTGRDITVVADLIAVDGLGYVGSHGLDIHGPPASGFRKEVAADCVPALDAAEAGLREALSPIAGVVVERKRFSLSVHFRLAAEDDVARVGAEVARQARRHPSLRREAGKKLFELRPDVAWDKGAAVLWLLEASGRDPDLTLYIGDDLTDETVFLALDGRGVTIVVAAEDRPTAARFRLRDPADVGVLLERVVHRHDPARR